MVDFSNLSVNNLLIFLTIPDVESFVLNIECRVANGEFLKTYVLKQRYLKHVGKNTDLVLNEGIILEKVSNSLSKPHLLSPGTISNYVVLADTHPYIELTEREKLIPKLAKKLKVVLFIL